jgi:hypothetical protein
MTIYQVSTGQFVSNLDPFELTVNESDAMDFNDEDADDVVALLEQEQNESFAKGRPKDRQPK